MKTVKIFVVTAIVLFAFGCNTKNDVSNKNKLTTEDSLKVVKEVNDAIDNYTQAHISLNSEKTAEYFVNSPELVVAENSELTPNWDAVAKQIKDVHATFVSPKLSLENRKVLALSLNSAAVTCKISFEALTKDKKKFAAAGYATFVLAKQNDQWKFFQYHESYKILTK